ncbi:MAG: SH3 domain-containing protein [Christensenellales bacterium]|jgi:uncharacterized protein YraI
MVKNCKKVKLIKAALLLALSVVFLASPMMALAASVTATVPLNVRSGPGMDNPIVAVLLEGDIAQKGEVSGNWCQVILSDGTKGWASMAYLSEAQRKQETSADSAPVSAASPSPAPVQTARPTPSPQSSATPTPKAAANPSQQTYIAAVSTAGSLNIREGAGMGHAVIGYISAGEKMELLERGEGWHKVRKGNVIGWASAAYIRIIGEAEVPLGPTFKENNGAFMRLTGDTPYMILINKETQVGSVLSKDQAGYYTIPIRNFAVSSGKSSTPTPSGIFTVYEKHRWRFMKGDVYCQYLLRFDTHLLTHSLTYARKDPSTMHRSAYNKLGTQASSGCVRMRSVDALWLYENCETGTYVQIISGGETVAGIPESISYPNLPSGVSWDPTDPTEGNPVYGMYQD